MVKYLTLLIILLTFTACGEKNSKKYTLKPGEKITILETTNTPKFIGFCVDACPKSNDELLPFEESKIKNAKIEKLCTHMAIARV